MSEVKWEIIDMKGTGFNDKVCSFRIRYGELIIDEGFIRTSKNGLFVRVAQRYQQSFKAGMGSKFVNLVIFPPELWKQIETKALKLWEKHPDRDKQMEGKLVEEVKKKAKPYIK